MSLGKGLNSLIPQEREDKSKKTFQGIREIPLKQIEPNPNQPRQNFKETRIQELVDSIKIHGVLQPLIVEKKTKDKYQIIAGERRFRACRRLKKETVPVILKDVDASQKLEMSLIENIQRQDLNPIEKAEAFKHFIEDFGLTQKQISKKLGKSRSSIANTLRLVNLDEDIKNALRDNKISEGHARILLSLKNSSKQKILLRKIITNNLSVKETKKALKSKIKPRKTFPNKYQKQAEKLSNLLNTDVEIKQYKNKSKIIINTYSKEDINDIINKLT